MLLIQKILWFCYCYFCCQLQVIYVSQKYFSYPSSMVVKTISEPPKQEAKTVPDLTFCVILPPNYENFECSGNSTLISTARYLYKYFYDFEEKIDQFVIRNNINTTITPFVLGDSICFTASLNTQDTIKGNVSENDENVLLSVAFNLTQVVIAIRYSKFADLFKTSFHLTPHGHGFKRPPSPGFPYSLFSEFSDKDLGVYKKMSFQEMTFSLLPAPFADNCFDYASLKTQDNCFYECITKGFEKHNASSYNYPVHPKSELLRFSRHQDGRELEYDVIGSDRFVENSTLNCNWFNKTTLDDYQDEEGLGIRSLAEVLDLKEWRQLVKRFAVYPGWEPTTELICKEENEFCIHVWPFTPELELVDRSCQTSCGRQDCYSKKIIGQDLQSKHLKQKIEIHIVSPQALPQFIESVPHFTLTDYILYVLGCLEFWLAISPLAFVLDIEDVIGKFSSRKRRNLIMDQYNVVARNLLMEVKEWTNNLHTGANVKMHTIFFLRFFRNRHKIITIVIVLVGCVAQITYICQQYFTYSVSVQTSFSFPENISIPGITLCVFPEDFHSVTNINLSIRAFDGRTPEEILSEFPKGMIHGRFRPTFHLSGKKDFQLHRFLSHGQYCYDASVKDMNKSLSRSASLISPRGYGMGFMYGIQYDMRYSSQNRSRGVKINLHQNQHLDINSPEVLLYTWKQKKRPKGSKKHLHWNESLAEVTDKPRSAKYNQDIGYWYLHQHLATYSPTAEYIEHDSQYKPNMTETALEDYSLQAAAHSPMFVYSPNEDTMVMTYRKYSWEKMSPPYETDCIRYQNVLQIPHATKFDCFDVCLKKRVLEEMKVLPIHSVLSRFTTNMSTPIFDPDKRIVAEEINKYHRIKNECMTECSRDSCDKTTFALQILRYVDHEAIMIQFITEVYQPHEPDMKFTYSPSIDLIDFLVYAGNTISFWFGVAVIDLLLLRQSFAARARQFWRFTSKNHQQEDTTHTVVEDNCLEEFRKIQLKLNEIEKSLERQLLPQVPL